jgi:hypothetical protein
MAAVLVASCSDTSSADQCVESGPYIIGSSPQALDGVADYLLNTVSLESGSISTVGCGQEQDGTFRYYTTNNNKFYSLLYGQGDPGAVTSYQLSSQGKLNELVDFQSESFHAFTAVNDDILMMSIPRNSTDSMATWFQLNTQTDQFDNYKEDNTLNVHEVAGNGEMAYFSWMTQVDDQVWMPYFSISGEGNESFSTQHPDSAWVAVYSYPEMELQKVIKDDRTSYIGRYYTNGLSLDENGDAYAFSSSIAIDDNGDFNSTKPSAITRIPDGSTEFDNYYFNLEEASGGYYLTNHRYISNGNVLGFMRPVEERAPYQVGKNLAIINVYDKTMTWVEGLPDPADISSISGGSLAGVRSYVSEDDSTVSVGITTEQNSVVYNIDAETATASAGLEVGGGTITTIKKLDPAQ